MAYVADLCIFDALKSILKKTCTGIGVTGLASGNAAGAGKIVEIIATELPAKAADKLGL
ncbi:MAG: hypothetical protein ACQEP5_08510 [Actinomycetota bacterium]